MGIQVEPKATPASASTTKAAPIRLSISGARAWVRVVGNPLMPVIKLTANPEVAASMPEHIDVDVSGLLQRKMTLDQAGQLLEAHLLRTCNGRLTATESLGHRELSMTRLFRTA